jgi:hypothetical protein
VKLAAGAGEAAAGAWYWVRLTVACSPPYWPLSCGPPLYWVSPLYWPPLLYWVSPLYWLPLLYWPPLSYWPAEYCSERDRSPPAAGPADRGAGC